MDGAREVSIHNAKELFRLLEVEDPELFGEFKTAIGVDNIDKFDSRDLDFDRMNEGYQNLTEKYKTERENIKKQRQAKQKKTSFFSRMFGKSSGGGKRKTRRTKRKRTRKSARK